MALRLCARRPFASLEPRSLDFARLYDTKRLQAVRHTALELKLKCIVVRVPGVPDCGDIVDGSHERRGNDVIPPQHSSAIGPKTGCRQRLFRTELPLNGGIPLQGNRKLQVRIERGCVKHVRVKCG